MGLWAGPFTKPTFQLSYLFRGAFQGPSCWVGASPVHANTAFLPGVCFPTPTCTAGPWRWSPIGPAHPCAFAGHTMGVHHRKQLAFWRVVSACIRRRAAPS